LRKLLEFERLERLFLRSDQQLAVKRTFGGAAVEGFFRGKAGKVGIIVFLREVREDKVARARVETFRVGKIFADSVIREMPGAAEDALLDDPRIRPDFEHVQIVIRFEQQAIGVAQMNLDEFGHVAEVRDERHLRAIGAEREPDRIGGIVRNLKRVNINVPYGEMLAGLNGFHTTQTLRQPIWQGAVQRVHRGFRNVKWSFPKAEHLRKTVAVVGVFVGDENAVDAIDAQFDGREPRESFAFAEAAIHKESGTLRLEQGDVARAARRQDGNPQADRLLPENRRAKARLLQKRIFRMMAEPRDLVNAQSMIMPSRKK